MQPTAQAGGRQAKREQAPKGRNNLAQDVSPGYAQEEWNKSRRDGTNRHTKTKEDVCPGKKLELAAVREKIDFATAHDKAEKTGPEYWRSLEELAGSEDFQTALHREFPKGASEWLDSVSRRGFLKVMGASLGLAGMTGCVRLPLEPIVPYVRQPEE